MRSKKLYYFDIFIWIKNNHEIIIFRCKKKLSLNERNFIFIYLIIIIYLLLYYYIFIYYYLLLEESWLFLYIFVRIKNNDEIMIFAVKKNRNWMSIFSFLSIPLLLREWFVNTG